MTRQLPVRPEEDALIAQRYREGARDAHIAEELGRSPSTVHRARKRLGLTPHYGPGRPPREESRS
jgi:IS30 family transposase